MKITLVPFSPVLPAVVLLRYKSDTSADTFSWCSDLACMICCFTDTVDGLFVISKRCPAHQQKVCFYNKFCSDTLSGDCFDCSFHQFYKPLNDRKSKSGSLDTAERRVLLPFKGSTFFHKEGLIPHPICIVQSAIAPKIYSIRDSESVLSWCISPICSDVFIQ